MNRPTPIKRDKSLLLLSRDHHDGLLVVWKIRQGIRLNIEKERIADFVINSFEQKEAPHFSEEEQLLFAKLPVNDEWRLQAETDHAAIRNAVATLKSGNKITIDDLEAFANMLEAHIRFEERTLFPHFEKTVSPEVLEETGQLLAADYRNKTPFVWKDEFWIKPKENAGNR